MPRRFQRQAAECPLSAETICLAVLGLCVCVSGAAGCFFASVSYGGGASDLSALFDRIFRNASGGNVVYPEFVPVLFEFFIVPAVLFVLGYTFLGVFLVPACIGFRAFFLSYAVTALFCSYGMSGLALSTGCFGLHALISVPVWLAVGSVSLFASFRHNFGRKEEPLCVVKRIVFAAVGTALLLPAALMQWSVMPRIVCVLAKLFADNI